MKSISIILLAAAAMASSAVAGSADVVAGLSNIHAPVLRRSTVHNQKRKCAAGSHHKKHSKHHKNTHTSSNGSKTADDSVNTQRTTSTGSGKALSLKSKQGLAWPNANGMNINNFLTGGVSWYYSWSDTPKWDSAPDNVPFCPMLWGTGGSGGNLEGWKKNVLDNPNGKYNKWKCMMGPNEVNQQGQADMSPSDTCTALRKYMMPLADQGWYFIGPSTTSAPDGLTQWYAEFKQNCADVFNRLDAIALHWYDVSPAAFKTYVQNWHEKMGKDIWITEFACQNFNGGAQCSKDDATAMMKEMSDWFMTQDYVKGFSPFGVMQNLQGVDEVNRLSQGSSPTGLFKIFADAT